MALTITQAGLGSDANLKGYWTLDDILTDSGPNGYTLTTSGSPAFVAGKFNNALEFVRTSNQYALTGTDATGLNTTGSQSWLMWLKPTSATTRAGAMSIFNSGVGERKVWIDSNLDLYGRINGLSTETIGPYTLGGANVFYHIAMVYNAATGKFIMYINASANSTDVTGTPTTLTVNQMTFGQDNGNAYHNAVQDDMAFFDRALTAGEIDNIVNGTPATGRTAAGARTATGDRTAAGARTAVSSRTAV